VLDLVQQVRVHVAEIVDLRPHRVLEGDTEDLLVGTLLVAHAEEADRRALIRQPGKVGSPRLAGAFG
jgi:hypothetical protein